MYFSTQAPMALSACSRQRKFCSQTHSSFSVRITRSTTPFCSGVYGVMNSCCRPVLGEVIEKLLRCRGVDPATVVGEADAAAAPG